MPSSTPNPQSLKFLIDENVKIKLAKSLGDQDFDIKLTPKTSSDSIVASLSFKEKRILVTNDEDFQWYSKEEIYSVVWLWIPQNDTQGLINSFKKLIDECTDFAGKIIILEKNEWRSYSLPIIVKV